MKKKKSLVKEFRSDSPDTYLSTDIDQQKNMLLETIEDMKPKKINRYEEPEITEIISVPRSRPIKKIKLTAPSDFFEKNNSNVNSGLAGNFGCE